MNSRRTAKASRAIKEVVSKAILFELNDPRVKNVTVLDVEVALDMRSAKVYVSIMGPAKGQDLALHGLNSARGFLQKRIGEQIDTRYTPILSFVKDDSVKKSIQAAQILQKLAEERGEFEGEQAEGASDSAAEADDDSSLAGLASDENLNSPEAENDEEQRVD